MNYSKPDSQPPSELHIDCQYQPCAGTPQSNVFFSWSLPLLSTTGNANPMDWHSQYWVLVALQECMAAVDDAACARHAPAVLQAIQGLLESENTSVHLLTPILGVVLQVRTLYNLR